MMATLFSSNLKLFENCFQVPKQRFCSATINHILHQGDLSTTATQRLPTSGFSVSFPTDIGLAEPSNTRQQQAKSVSKAKRTPTKSLPRKSKSPDPNNAVQSIPASENPKQSPAESTALHGPNVAEGFAVQQPNIQQLVTSNQSSNREKKEDLKALTTFPPRPLRKKEEWQIQKNALKAKFGDEGWSPRKKLSPDTIEGIRALQEQYPEKYTTPILATEFKVSPESIRRILKSKWRPKPEEMEDRRQRWAKRHDRIWDQKAEIGLLPPRVKEKQPESPEAFEEDLRARQVLANQ